MADAGFSRLDAMLHPWAASNGLLIDTRYRDEEVRSIPVVDGAGREFQIWIEPRGESFVVHASNNRTGNEQRSWTSEAVDVVEITRTLDRALATVRDWMSDA